MNYMSKLALFVMGSFLLLPQVVSANEAELTAKLQLCSEINQNEARLSCFDQLASKQADEELAAQKTGLTAQQVDDFSKGHVIKTDEQRAKEINSITLTISKLTKTAQKQWKITFENGQKWLQKDGNRMKLKIGEVVTLHKGALGAVYLQKENANKRIKVKRLK